MMDSSSSGGPEVSLAQVIARGWEHRRTIFGLPIALALLTLVVTLLQPRTFTSTAAVVPQVSTTDLSRFTGVAAQLGLSVPGADQAASPQFYADFVRSDFVLRSLVGTKYPGADGTRATLIEQMEPRSGDSRRAEALAVRRLRTWMSVATNLRTGVVTIGFRTARSALSKALVERALDQINEFNLRTRQTQAGAERRFVEARVAESLRDLSGAEDRLQRFLQENREFRSSPRLSVDYERIQREVNRYQGVYAVLLQSYEQARIGEVRDTPVITVVEPPVEPALPDSRLALAKTFLAAVVGLLIALVVVGIRRVRLSRPRDANVSE